MNTKNFDEIWEDIHSSREWGHYPPEHIVRFVMRYFKDVEHSKVRCLDIGCGGGGTTWFLAREGFNVYALDGSHSAVSKAEKYLARDGLTANFKVMSANNMNYDKNYFDFSIDNGTSCVCGTREDIHRIYEKVFEILRPGGIFLTTGFTCDSIGAGEGEYLSPNTYRNEVCGNGGQMHYSTKMEMSEMLRECGFKEMHFDSLCFSDSGRYFDMVIAVGKKDGVI